VRDLVTSAPSLTELIAKAKVEREAEIKRWQEQARIAEARRRGAAPPDRGRPRRAARGHRAWADACNAEEFFDDATRRAAALPEDQRLAIEARLQCARELLGGTDALARLRGWRTPEER
jgi:hypothetical protein